MTDTNKAHIKPDDEAWWKKQIGSVPGGQTIPDEEPAPAELASGGDAAAEDAPTFGD